MSHRTRSWPGLWPLVLISISCLIGCHSKREYPNRPIMLVCPWTAGGGTDLVSRQIATLLEQELRAPVNVINATGGAGVTGHTRGALARPDGYTLTMITVELNMLHWRGLTSISHRDYRPAVLLNRDAAALFVRSDAPWTNLTALTEHVRTHRGALRASGTAHGGIWHLALAGWLNSLGLQPTDLNWISINGAAPSLQELLAGGVEIVCCSLPEARPLMEAGRIRCLGVMADSRVEPFLSIPTFKEQGIDWTMGGWRGVAVPAGTPDAVFTKLADALDRIVHGEPFKQFMRNTGFNWSFEEPAEFRKTLEELDQKFGEILNAPAFQSMGKRRIGPMFFPGLIAIVGVALLLALARESRPTRSNSSSDPLADQPSTGTQVPVHWLRLAEVTAGIGLYLLLAEVIGFILTGTILLGIWIWRLSGRWIQGFAIGIAISIGMYQIFGVYLRVPLPQGWMGW